MPSSATPTQSAERLAALRSSGLLDSPAEPAFDRLTKLITLALRVPVALISFVDADRQFFKSQCGLPSPVAEERQTPLSHSFCQHVVNLSKPLIVSNALANDLVRENLAIRDLGVIAYAGVPIRDEDGYVLGSLCAIDTKPREWSDEDIELLESLSAQATLEIQLRTQSVALAETLEEQRTLHANRQAMNRLNVHDLRTPLTALLMGVELLPRLGKFNEEQKTGLAICKRSGKALLDLVDNLLDIGAVEHRGGLALRQCESRPAEIVAQAVEQVLPIAVDKSIELKNELNPKVPLLFADQDKLVRVVVNLLGNAIKFTDTGGRVGVTAAETSDGTRPFVQFTVSDTGIGMSPNERIFDEGVRLDPKATTRQSTGLGLTFCKRIVEAHGGRIWYESEPGAGSVFHFTIPATRA